MGFLAGAGSAHAFDPVCPWAIPRVSPARNVLGIGVQIEDKIVTGPFASSKEVVPKENPPGRPGVELPHFASLLSGGGFVVHSCPERNKLPRENLSMPQLVGGLPVRTVGVTETTQCAESARR